MKKYIRKAAAAALCVSLAFCLPGCGPKNAGNAGKTVSVYTAEFSSKKWDGRYDAVIEFDGKSAQTGCGSVRISDGFVTITDEGTYLLKGSLDGQLAVDAPDSKVRLILAGADISCADSSAIYIANANKVYITLADGTENSVSDGEEYDLDSDNSDEPNAAIFSCDDVIFDGGGRLTVSGNYSNGIRSKDSIEFLGGEYLITAANNAVSGKDSVAVKDGNFTINADGDGIKTTSGDVKKGWIYISGGSFDITAAQDGIQAETTLGITGGRFNITTGGGLAEPFQQGDMNDFTDKQKDFTDKTDSEMPEPPAGGTAMDENAPPEPPQNVEKPAPVTFDGMEGPPESFGGVPFSGEKPDEAAIPEQDISTESAKGIKAGGDIKLSGGEFGINALDDGIHCGNDLEIVGGSFEISSGDDGIHADNAVIINDGEINVARSNEGVEGLTVDINGGAVSVTASNDGINAAGGSDDKASEHSSEHYISVNGGDIKVNARGDGLDSNGGLFMKGGSLYVSGPSDNGNAALDFDTEFIVTGGSLVAFGSSGMALNADKSSKQRTLLAVLGQPQNAGCDIEISLKKSGKVLYSGKAEKNFDCVQISTPEMKSGDTVIIKSNGKVCAEAELSGMVTTFGSTGMTPAAPPSPGSMTPPDGIAPPELPTPPDGMNQFNNSTPPNNSAVPDAKH